ncbi:mechanosensitive ion channel family protein [Anaerovorax odorimutans]|uniref:mechanosensitive ion channel family protein n=1 Tax=Anaerovorax odorimutans TaxID=109327 RepID=UPI00040D929C|nr:mechanosensitive ion channel family protein [Anaerovorax odorimutans]
MIKWFDKFLIAQGLSETISKYISGVVILIFIVIVSMLAYFIAIKILLKILSAIIAKSKTKWDDIILHHKVFERLILVIPALIVHSFAPTFPAAQEWIRRIAFCLIVFGILMALDKLLDAIDDIYSNYEISKFRPIKGYLQVLKIVAYIIGAIIILSALMDKSPLLLLGGIGAATAVLLLIFQNTILGFVASLQLTENDMVRLGDWIEMSKHGADGEVTEITLHTVKVQNWDNTITTIPTYALVSESFKNWRPMQEAGGRRIAKSVYIDMTSIKFCDTEMLERYEKVQYIRDYLKEKVYEVDTYNKRHKIDESSVVNGRALTNIGTFRAYVDAYLKNHPKIHKSMTRIVRQLNPTEHGLPIEIYAFTNTTVWKDYEDIQADIFDHIFAILPQFDLRIFQSPTGHDLKNVQNLLKDIQ